ncbi:unnamed protein product [Parnassius apollo]|uniref:(apollo) hypothetical protein n=1 Tax=Parnassius apollo TaxID=110799 RepID=A0A8S3XCQ8_PARAO|nr:unnamed protein product [Parnassius apollo]
MRRAAAITIRGGLTGLGRLHPYGSGSGSSSGSGRRRNRARGLSESPTAPTTPTSASDNASDATLTDSELPLARDSTLLVQNVSYGATLLTCPRGLFSSMPLRDEPEYKAAWIQLSLLESTKEFRISRIRWTRKCASPLKDQSLNTN